MNTLWSRIRGLVLFGWLVALIRFGLEASLHPNMWDPAWFVGVYFLMPVAFLIAGIRGTFDDLRWPKIALIALLLGVFVWGLPNAITYTTGQFLGWRHGRFEPPDPATGAERSSAPVAATAFGKIGTGLMVAGGTTIGGTVWCLVFMTLLIWVPAVIRRRRRGPPPLM